MPRYESGDDSHIILKLKSGYNVGININEIQKIEVTSNQEVKSEIILIESPTLASFSFKSDNDFPEYPRNSDI